MGRSIYEELKAARPGLEAEIGLPLDESARKDDPFQEEAYLAWLVENANRVISALRPFLAQFS